MKANAVNYTCDSCSAPCVEMEEPGPRQTKIRRWRSPNLDIKTAAALANLTVLNNMDVKRKLVS